MNWQNRDLQTFTTASQTSSSSLVQFMTQIYTWMALGLGLTGLVSVVTMSSPALLNFVFGNSFVFILLLVAEIGLVVAFGAAATRGASFSTLLGMFLGYSALNGLTLSALLLAFTGESVARAFFITAGTFGAMSFYGFVTKRDLSGMGRVLFMGLIGLIIAMVVNIFLGSSMMDWLISIAGLGIFIGLTAYDTQTLKQIYYHHAHNEDGLKRTALQGALKLYLDFINMFIFILRLTGDRR